MHLTVLAKKDDVLPENKTKSLFSDSKILPGLFLNTYKIPSTKNQYFDMNGYFG